MCEHRRVSEHGVVTSVDPAPSTPGPPTFSAGRGGRAAADYASSAASPTPRRIRDQC